MFASGVRQLKCNKLRPISARLVSNASTAKKERKPAETSSFSMNIFRGKAQLDNVFPYPLNLSSDQRETLNMIVDPTEKFLTEVNDLLKNDETASQPPEVLRQFGELGAFGALVPVEYEGAGLNNSQMARLAEIVGAHDLGLGVTMGAHQSIGYKGILLYGDEAMKKKYLPDLATGRKFASFCLTEPGSGSDANSISSTITKSDDGKHYILNGNKIFISNGGFAEVFTVFAQQPIKQADGSTKNKVTAVVVERAFGGVTNGPPEKKMGIKGSNTVTMNFDNVKIPIENRLGEEGEGFKVAMNILNNGRFGIPASMTGTMKYVIQKTVDHVTNRVQFGRKLEEYGNVKEKLSQMIVKHYASESIVYMLAATMDAGVQDYQLEAACGKVFTSEAAWWCTDEAIQLHGGYGFIRETALEVFLRDLRIFRIFEGANDVLRLFVALTGIQHAGLHLQQTAKEIKSGGIGTLFGELTKRVTGGSTGGDFLKVVDSAFTSEAATLDAAIKDFGATIEKLLLKYKKGIIERQFELTRIGDAAIDIFALTCVLSRATFSAKHGAASFEHEKDIVKLFAEQAASRITANLKVAREGSPTEVSLIEKIATDVCKNGGLPQRHPIEL
ncbi:unnamed protein product, partial [Mesorhabditis belari]|uniref:Very long-chain specific acyl-CoA dehydrogenase, mitochondrial n=1 Tax=Mesorhabditis belari TaxID=2138241 RepID=A0AAF3FGA5_9BILA